MAMPENPPQGGEEVAYVPASFGDMVINVGGSALGIQFYEAARNQSNNEEAKSYAFSPYFAFISFDTPPVVYKVFNEPGGLKTVRMRLALFDDVLKQAAASWVAERTNSYVPSSAVQMLPLWHLRIAENNTNAKAEFPEGSASPTVRASLSPVQDVFFRHLRPEVTTALMTDIDNHNSDFTFEYSFQKSGSVLATSSVTLADIAKTSVFQQLTGGGASSLVTRNGAVQVASSVVSSLDIRTYIEDQSSIQDLTNDVLRLFLDKMHYKEKLDYTSNDAMQRLSSLSIDPRGRDFEADIISKTHDVIASSHDFNELNRNLREGGGGVGYGPFKADANFKSNDEVNKAIKDTFNEDWTGNDWSSIPKTVNVYQVNGADFQGTATVRQVQVKPTFFMQSYSVSNTQPMLSMAELDNVVRSREPDRFALLPIGSVIAFGGVIDTNHKLPHGWLFCDGSPLKAAEYPPLFQAVGTAHGDGRDPNDTKLSGYDFNLPDLRGFFLRGVDAGSGRDKDVIHRTAAKTGGNIRDAVGSVEPDSLASHPHEIDDPGHSHEIKWGQPIGLTDSHAIYERGAQTKPGPNPETYSKTTGITIPATGGGGETRPKNVSVYWIIRAQ